MLMRESALTIVTAWEIFDVALTTVVGQMKPTVAPTHPMKEVFVRLAILGLFRSLLFTKYNAYL